MRRVDSCADCRSLSSVFSLSSISDFAFPIISFVRCSNDFFSTLRLCAATLRSSAALMYSTISGSSEAIKLSNNSVIRSVMGTSLMYVRFNASLNSSVRRRHIVRASILEARLPALGSSLLGRMFDFIAAVAEVEAVPSLVSSPSNDGAGSAGAPGCKMVCTIRTLFSKYSAHLIITAVGAEALPPPPPMDAMTKFTIPTKRGQERVVRDPQNHNLISIVNHSRKNLSIASFFVLVPTGSYY